MTFFNSLLEKTRAKAWLSSRQATTDATNGRINRLIFCLCCRITNFECTAIHLSIKFNLGQSHLLYLLRSRHTWSSR